MSETQKTKNPTIASQQVADGQDIDLIMRTQFDTDTDEQRNFIDHKETKKRTAFPFNTSRNNRIYSRQKEDAPLYINSQRNTSQFDNSDENENTEFINNQYNLSEGFQPLFVKIHPADEWQMLNDEDSNENHKVEKQISSTTKKKFDKIERISQRIKGGSFIPVKQNVDLKTQRDQKNFMANRFLSKKELKRKNKTQDAEDSGEGSDEDEENLRMKRKKQQEKNLQKRFDGIFDAQGQFDYQQDMRYERLFQKFFKGQKQQFKATETKLNVDENTEQRTLQVVKCTANPEGEFFIVSAQYINKSKNKKNDMLLEVFKLDQDTSQLVSDNIAQLQVGCFNLNPDSNRRERLCKIPLIHPKFASFKVFGQFLYYFRARQFKDKESKRKKKERKHHLKKDESDNDDELEEYQHNNYDVEPDKNPDDRDDKFDDSSDSDADQKAAVIMAADTQSNGTGGSKYGKNKIKKDHFELVEFDLVNKTEHVMSRVAFPAKICSDTNQKYVPVSIVFDTQAVNSQVYENFGEARPKLSLLDQIFIGIVYRGKSPNYTNGSVSFRKFNDIQKEILFLKDEVDLTSSFIFSSFGFNQDLRGRKFIGINYSTKGANGNFDSKLKFHLIPDSQMVYQDEEEASKDENEMREYLEKYQSSMIDLPNDSSTNLHCTIYDEKTNQTSCCLESVRGTHVYKNIEKIIGPLSKIDPENAVHHKSQTYTMLLDYNNNRVDKKPIYLIIAAKTKLLVYKGNLDQRDRQIVHRINNYSKMHNKRIGTPVLPLSDEEMIRYRTGNEQNNSKPPDENTHRSTNDSKCKDDDHFRIDKYSREVPKEKIFFAHEKEIQDDANENGVEHQINEIISKHKYFTILAYFYESDLQNKSIISENFDAIAEFEQTDKIQFFKVTIDRERSSSITQPTIRFFLGKLELEEKRIKGVNCKKLIYEIGILKNQLEINERNEERYDKVDDSFVHTIMKAFSENQLQDNFQSTFSISTRYTNIIRDPLRVYFKTQPSEKIVSQQIVTIQDKKMRFTELNGLFYEISEEQSFEYQEQDACIFWINKEGKTIFKKGQQCYKLIYCQDVQSNKNIFGQVSQKKEKIQLVKVETHSKNEQPECISETLMFKESKRTWRALLAKCQDFSLHFVIIDVKKMKVVKSELMLSRIRGCSVRISRSSDIYKIDDQQNYYQHYHICSKSKRDITIDEMIVCWSETNKGEITYMEQIGQKRLIPRDESILSEFLFIPLFHKDSLFIEGTQLIMKKAAGMLQVVKIPNSRYKDLVKSNSCVSYNAFKRYYNYGSDKVQFVLSESTLKLDWLFELTDYEKIKVLIIQNYTLLNMIPMHLFDWMQRDLNSRVNFFQPVEAVACYSRCDFEISSPNVIKDQIHNLKNEQNKKQEATQLKSLNMQKDFVFRSLIERVIWGNEEAEEYFLKVHLYRNVTEISRDFNLQSALDRCLYKVQEDKMKNYPMSISSEILIQEMIDQGKHKRNQDSLFKAFSTILQSKLEIDGFSKFMKDQDEKGTKQSYLATFKFPDKNLPMFSHQASTVLFFGDENIEQMNEEYLHSYLQKKVIELELERGESVVDHRIQNMVSDWRTHNMFVTIDNNVYIKRNKTLAKEKKHMSQLELSYSLMKINSWEDGNIEEMRAAQCIINFQYTNSKNVFRCLILLELAFLLAFLMQVLADHNVPGNDTLVLKCNVFCLIIGTIFFFIEILQAKFMGAEYYMYKQNYVEAFNYLIIVIYFFMRLNDRRVMVPFVEAHIESQMNQQASQVSTEAESKTSLDLIIQNLTKMNGFYDNSQEFCDNSKRLLEAQQTTPHDHIIDIQTHFWYTLFNLTLTLLTTFKLLFLLSFQEDFGVFITLMGNCLIEVGYFLVFFIMWILLFTFIFIIVGLELSMDETGTKEDFPMIFRIAQYFLQTYRNSIGDIAPPGYQFWLEKKQQFGQESISQSMIGVVLFFWIMNQFLVFVVLLNFLIAIVSQSYEKVQNNRSNNVFDYRSQINFEAQLIQDFIGRTFCIKSLVRSTKIDCLTVSGQIIPPNEQSKHEWKGFVNLIKSFIGKLIKKNQQNVINKLSNMKQDLLEIYENYSSNTPRINKNYQLLQLALAKQFKQDKINKRSRDELTSFIRQNEYKFKMDSLDSRLKQGKMRIKLLKKQIQETKLQQRIGKNFLQKFNSKEFDIKRRDDPLRQYASDHIIHRTATQFNKKKTLTNHGNEHGLKRAKLMQSETQPISAREDLQKSLSENMSEDMSEDKSENKSVDSEEQ